ncbi:hypothetical protein FOZ62_005818 [Perkinsus olseni]|uniref:Uncharacterized protein n=2 Tax=Perkinsus olseni TaxID=32597 RepID=A0A7J6QQ25_PEROL|nr:hypothetical protein FOZ62_005818 [Perkinsus olseni]
MKSPAHVMALEVKMFEGLMSERGRNGNLPEILGDFCAGLKRKRKCDLVVAENELVLNPPPSYIFVMNEDLCGVYPTPTGVYIRKPLERGEEVMVLQPGFQGTKAVYYYHNNKSQLFVLCEDNRKLIIYDLSASPERPGVTSEVLGLPGLATCYSRKMDMVSNDDYIFILIATGHLFYINRRDIRDTVQAYLGWSTDGSTGRCDHLLLDPERASSIKVIMIERFSFNIAEIALASYRGRPGRAHFMELRTTQKRPSFGLSTKLVTIVPVEGGMFGLVTRESHTGASKKKAKLHLLDRHFRPLCDDHVTIADDYKEAYHLQILSGPGDALYVLRRDMSFAVQPHFNVPDDRSDRTASSSDSVISDACPTDDPKRLTVFNAWW